MWSNIVKGDETVDLPEEVVAEPPEADSESIISSESDSDCSTEYNEEYESIGYTTAIPSFLNRCWSDKSDPETFGWPVNPIENTIKRFRLKKLKSVNQKIYMYDNVYHYIWELNHDASVLIKPASELSMRLRNLNEITAEPFLAQPNEFW
jgi:hypothetical protein